MTRLDDPHDLRCPVHTRGADPDDCQCDDEQGYSPRPRPSGRLTPRRPDAGCSPPWKRQHIDMSKLWTAAGVTRRRDRLTLTGVLLERATPSSSNELTVGDADLVVRQLTELETVGRLRDWAAETLAGRAAG